MKKMADSEIKNGSIIFTGFIEWTQVHVFYESCDLFITASLSEMHSMTILEAELSGLPIIVRKDDSYADSVFDGENGYIADSDEDMLEKILLLLSDTKKLKALGKKSLEITKKFTIESHVKKTILVYEQVIKAYPNKISDEEVNKLLAKL